MFLVSGEEYSFIWDVGKVLLVDWTPFSVVLVVFTPASFEDSSDELCAL
jgi:hypothetical protein